MPTILLVDNGSVRADAVLGLRKLAKQLSKKQTTQPRNTVFPVSLKHADSIPADELNGEKAHTFRKFMSNKIAEGETSFVVLPLFFGESKAVTSFIPDEVNVLKDQFGEFDVKIADVLFLPNDGDNDLVNILYDHVLDTATNNKLELGNIVLVDHGSPSPKVTEVRHQLAKLILEKMNGVQIDEAVMERREGKEYDFNGKLLEQYLLEKAQAGESQAIVVLQFLLAGRHAGKDGDIVTICDSVTKQYPNFNVVISPLISEHPELVTLLAKRLKEVSV